MQTNHWIIGLSGLELTRQERDCLQHYPPKGVILFSRNTSSAEQVTSLLDDVRQCSGEATWAAIDEEGGRIFRMPFSPFSQRRTAANFGAQFQQHQEAALQAVYDDAYNTGMALAALGFSHNCAPILDLYRSDAHQIIGNRAYADNVNDVAALATASMRGLRAAGVEAVGKHFPGHGRAQADSHQAVPIVEADAKTLLHEAESFHLLIKAGLSHIMTAHVIYPSWDKNIATFSSSWLQLLRQKFSFQGSIWSDDLCMKGAGVDMVDAIKQSSEAGCDALLICEAEAVQLLYQKLG